MFGNLGPEKLTADDLLCSFVVGPYIRPDGRAEEKDCRRNRPGKALANVSATMKMVSSTGQK